MNTYTFYEITHAAGVPYHAHICERRYKTDKQAIRATGRDNALRRTAYIEVWNWINGNYTHIATLKAMPTDNGREFITIKN